MEKDDASSVQQLKTSMKQNQNLKYENIHNSHSEYSTLVKYRFVHAGILWLLIQNGFSAKEVCSKIGLYSKHEGSINYKIELIQQLQNQMKLVIGQLLIFFNRLGGMLE